MTRSLPCLQNPRRPAPERRCKNQQPLAYLTPKTVQTMGGKGYTFSTEFYSDRNLSSEYLTFSVTAKEEKLRYGVVKKLVVPIEPSETQPLEIVVEGEKEPLARPKTNPEPVDYVTVNIPEGRDKRPEALAVVIGIEEYKDIQKATFADRDGYFFKRYLKKTFGIPENRMLHLSNENATLSDFRTAFKKGGWLDRRLVKGKSDLFIFFAGHIALDVSELNRPRSYLVPFDGKPNYPKQSCYDIDDLYADIDNLSARSTTVFLDACFSGTNREEGLLTEMRGPTITVPLPAAENLTVFSAASEGQTSHPYREKEQGLFTYFLLKGLQGSADANRNRELTVGELHGYLAHQIPGSALDQGFSEQLPTLRTPDRSRILVKYK